MNNLWGLIYVSKTPLLLNKDYLKNFNMLKIWASSLSNPQKGHTKQKMVKLRLLALLLFILSTW